MRQLTQFVFALNLIFNNSLFAAEPVQGFYLGLQGEISHAPNRQFTFTIPPTTYTGNISLEPVGGGMGASIGYKVQRFRLEGELLVNVNSYNKLQVGTCTLISPDVLGPRGVCPAYIAAQGLGFKGTTTGVYELFNVFFDFQSNDPNVNFVPFIGAGIGAAQLINNAKIQNNEFAFGGATPVSLNFSATNTSAAAQGIIGLNYYIDDFVTIGIDFRYLSTLSFNNTNANSTTTLTNTNNKQYGVGTINFTGNFALEKGE